MFDIKKLRARGVPEDSIKICQQINDMNDKRESCTGHRFVPPERFGGKHICEHCGYEADSSYVMGYNDGLKHCGGLP